MRRRFGRLRLRFVLRSRHLARVGRARSRRARIRRRRRAGRRAGRRRSRRRRRLPFSRRVPGGASGDREASSFPSGLVGGGRGGSGPRRAERARAARVAGATARAYPEVFVDALTPPRGGDGTTLSFFVVDEDGGAKQRPNRKEKDALNSARTERGDSSVARLLLVARRLETSRDDGARVGGFREAPRGVVSSRGGGDASFRRPRSRRARRRGVGGAPAVPEAAAMVARVAGTHPELLSADAETAILERFLRRRARRRGGDEGANNTSGATEATRSDAPPSRPSDASVGMSTGPRVQTAEAAEAARVRDGAAERVRAGARGARGRSQGMSGARARAGDRDERDTGKWRLSRYLRVRRVIGRRERVSHSAWSASTTCIFLVL